MTGWIIINDADEDDLELSVEDWHLFGKTIPEIEDLPADSRTGFDLGYRKRTLLLIGIRFENRDDAEDCLKFLDEWNDEGPFGIKIQVSGTPSYIKQDGVNTELKYLYIDYSELKKMSGGNIQQYRIGRLLFKQAE